MELIVFAATAALAIVSACVAVVHRQPVVNVLSLIVTFFCVAVNFALLGASFLAAAQILVYAGAILVLFLFVVMLLNAPVVEENEAKRPLQRWGGILLPLVLLAGGAAVLTPTLLATAATPTDGTAHALGRLLVGPHLFAFELVSVLLLAALVAAMVLVKRKQ
ncbi:MAG: NADH-quinone oxidoreductase subunit J [Thermoanaerobaculaceae bacterium]|nr:NADH-quinone oxidoreductase subunit J [Thermoanaerobaculaceae bacterium]